MDAVVARVWLRLEGTMLCALAFATNLPAVAGLEAKLLVLCVDQVPQGACRRCSWVGTTQDLATEVSPAELLSWPFHLHSWSFIC